MKKHLLQKLFAAFLAITLLAGSASAQVQVEAGGAMVLHYLLRDIATIYNSNNPEVSVNVAGGGAGAQLPQLISGALQFLNSPLTLDEHEKSTNDAGAPSPAAIHAARIRNENIPIRAVPIGVDGLDFFVHPSNPVGQLTLEQLRDIFRGKYTNWSELGGNNIPITLYWSGHHTISLPRLNAAGNTPLAQDHKGFMIEEWFLSIADEMQLAPTLQMPPRHPDLVFTAVSNNPGGIGYDGIFFVNRNHRQGNLGTTRSLTILGPDEAEDPARGDEFSRKYPVGRILYVFYHEDLIIPEARDFIDFLLSPEGQRLIGRQVMPLMPPARTFEIGVMPVGRPELEQTVSFQENISNRVNFDIDMHGETEFVVFARNNTLHDGTFPALRTANGTIENRGLFVVHRAGDPETSNSLPNNNVTELNLQNIGRGDVMSFNFNGQTINVAFEPDRSSSGCNAGALTAIAGLLLLPFALRKKRK